MIKTKFQILSDLHLEVGDQYAAFEIPPCAPYLILAGDIGRLVDYDRYHAFLARQCARFQKVFLVLGNHEFYGTTQEDGLALAEKLASSLDNLILLQRNAIEVDGVLVAGCVLYSNVPQEVTGVVSQKVNDFRRIKDWTVAKHNEAHQQDLAWLEEELKSTQAARILVITHYAPEISQTSAPDKITSPIVSNFATELLDIESHPELSKIHTWVFGHTHYTTDFKTAAGTRVVSNQRGYVFPGKEEQIPSVWTTFSQKLKILVKSSGPRVYDVRRTVEL